VSDVHVPSAIVLLVLGHGVQKGWHSSAGLGRPCTTSLSRCDDPAMKASGLPLCSTRRLESLSISKVQMTQVQDAENVSLNFP
jgi:hypothetical protein